MDSCLSYLSLTNVLQTITGTNAYTVIHGPRSSGAEAMVISASWISRNRDVNIRGVSMILALAKFLKGKHLVSRPLLLTTCARLFVLVKGHYPSCQR